MGWLVFLSLFDKAEMAVLTRLSYHHHMQCDIGRQLFDARWWKPLLSLVSRVSKSTNIVGLYFISSLRFARLAIGSCHFRTLQLDAYITRTSTTDVAHQSNTPISCFAQFWLLINNRSLFSQYPKSQYYVVALLGFLKVYLKFTHL